MDVRDQSFILHGLQTHVSCFYQISSLSSCRQRRVVYLCSIHRNKLTCVFYQANKRQDKWGGPDYLAVLRHIVSEIRALIPESAKFVIGVKVNAGDYVQAGVENDKALKDVINISNFGELMPGDGVDFIEISGGDYEQPGRSSCALFERAVVAFLISVHRVHEIQPTSTLLQVLT